MSKLNQLWLVGAPMCTPDLYAWHMDEWKVFTSKKEAEAYAKKLSWQDPNCSGLARRAFIQKVPLIRHEEIA